MREPFDRQLFLRLILGLVLFLTYWLAVFLVIFGSVYGAHEEGWKPPVFLNYMLPVAFVMNVLLGAVYWRVTHTLTRRRAK